MAEHGTGSFDQYSDSSVYRHLCLQDRCVQSAVGATRSRDIVVHETRNEYDRDAIAFYRGEEPGVVVGYRPREIVKTRSTRSTCVGWKRLGKPGNSCG